MMTTDSDTSWFLRLFNQRDDNQLRNEIISFHQSVVRSCRDKFALQDARSVVPIAELVQDNLDILEGDYQDNLLPILTQWFSNEFFTWFTPPACEKCNSQLTADRTRINPEELYVETYKCDNSTLCDYTFDFIRHNDPAILLRTRKGRCGEWANCFLLILRAMDYDARIVLDTTDHVWNEVWSESRQQWIHVDPCESVIDCPSLYESGWSKKLEYCIAFSKYEVIDVTRRYTRDINAIRRTRHAQGAQSSQSQEILLTKYLEELTLRAIEDLDESTRETILKRRAIDLRHLEEFETKGRPDVDVTQLGGRKTGSIMWRIARGEYSPIVRNLNVIRAQPTSVKESGDSMFSIEYNCDENIYISTSENLNKRGWQKLIYLAENIDHKYERDWKTSYLARYESCSPDKEGKIQWRFDMSALVNWTRIEIMMVAKTWPDTRLEAELILEATGDNDDSVTRELRLNEVNIITHDELGELKARVASVDLIISIGGGRSDDNTAWQKPQLFRQVRGDGSGPTFSFNIF